MYLLTIQRINDCTVDLGGYEDYEMAWEMAHYWAVDEWGEGKFTLMLTGYTNLNQTAFIIIDTTPLTYLESLV